MLPNLHRMAIFATVIDHDSFSRAAAALGLGKSVVSQHVAMLEKELRVRLINRSTRSLALTEEGRNFYARCRQMVDVAEGALAEVDASKGRLGGTIRLTASYNLGVSFLIACLAKFKAAHPAIVIDLVLDDAVINLIEEEFDLALRVGRLADSRFHAIKLAPSRLILCASPAYLARFEMPKTPGDLVHHAWVSISQLPHPERLILNGKDGRRRTVRVHPSIRTNTGIAARSFLLEGVGIGLLPAYAVTNEIADGSLVELLPDWQEASDRPISAIYPGGVHLPLKVRLLIDFLKAEFRRRYGEV